MRKSGNIALWATMLFLCITALGLTGLRPANAHPTDPCDWALDWL